MLANLPFTWRWASYLAVACLAFGTVQTAFAQVGSPFDLSPRLDSPATGELAVRTPPAGAADVSSTVERPRLKVTNRGRFDFILAFGLVILLTVSFVAQGNALRRMYAALLNDNLLGRLHREQRKGAYKWWGAVGAVMLGSFMFVALRQLRPDTFGYGWATLGAFAASAVGLVALRLLVLGLLGAAFPLGKALDGYRTSTYVWVAVVGVATIPATAVVAFGEAGIANALAHSGLALLGLAYVAYLLRATASASSYILGYPVHFLLYLCALEIGPLAIGYRTLVG